MSAQPGNNIGLHYRPQPPEAQSGAALWLEYTAPDALRRVASRVVAPWVLSRASRSSTRAVRPEAVLRDVRHALPWRIGVARGARQVPQWGVASQADRAAHAPWGRFARTVAPRAVWPWGVANTADRAALIPWGAYARRPARTTRPGWGQALARDTAAVLPWGVCVALDQHLRARHGRAVPAQAWHALPWSRYSRPLNPGWGVVTPPSAPPTDEHGTILVPLLRSYIVVNNVSLIRVADSQPIRALRLEVRIDADSWGWGWSASVPSSHRAALLPTAPGEPVELEAQINGVVWRLLVERITRDRRHPQDRLTISGRGIAAELAEPLYPATSRDNLGGAADAQQLAEAALTHNSVSLGWTLEWQIPDWLVPAGAWVHTGTPMDAVSRIAQAAGGYVQADPLQRILHMLPRYPVLPWEFGDATPDFILPSAATTRETTEYIERPPYNAVYITGGDTGGVLCHVKREGSAADLHAEMVVDPLITHVDAGRGRGSAILGNTGPQQIVTLETPILEDIGLYPVGALIEWQEGATTLRGLVRSVAATAQFPRVRQTIEVECHE